jgi:hypothetical protein
VCKSVGVVSGRKISESKPIYIDEDEVIVEETHAADTFACGPCGLSLKTIEEVLAGGIEPTFRVDAS